MCQASQASQAKLASCVSGGAQPSIGMIGTATPALFFLQAPKENDPSFHHLTAYRLMQALLTDGPKQSAKAC